MIVNYSAHKLKNRSRYHRRIFSLNIMRNLVLENIGFNYASKFRKSKFLIYYAKCIKKKKWDEYLYASWITLYCTYHIVSVHLYVFAILVYLFWVSIGTRINLPLNRSVVIFNIIYNITCALDTYDQKICFKITISRG